MSNISIQSAQNVNIHIDTTASEKPKQKQIRYRFSVPNRDKDILDWVAYQNNVSASIRRIIRESIIREGISEVTCRAELHPTKNQTDMPSTQKIDKPFDDTLDDNAIKTDENKPNSDIKFKYMLVGATSSLKWIAKDFNEVINIVETLTPYVKDNTLLLFNTDGICIRQIIRDKDNNIHLYTPYESLHGIELQDEEIAELLKAENSL